jgi:hypothetical protein
MYLIIQCATASGAVLNEKITLMGPSAAVFAALKIVQQNAKRKIDQQNNDHCGLISGRNEKAANDNGCNGAKDG